MVAQVAMKKPNHDLLEGFMCRFAAWMKCARILVVLALGIVAAFATLPSHAQERAPTGNAPSSVVAAEARIDAERDAVRLTLVLSGPVETRHFVMEGPNRLVIEFPEVNFQIPAEFARKNAGFVSGLRFGLFAPGRSRMVLDLTEPAILADVRVRARAGGLSEVTFELRKIDKERFSAAAAIAIAEARTASVASKPIAAAPSDKRPVIVLDPGHGGIDPGALTAGVAEKTIVLAFAQQLLKRLEAEGRYRVLMTRNDDRFVALDERVKVARDAGASLFISFHADSLSEAQEVRGATVYTGSERATDAEAARLAAKENLADQAAGVESGRDDSGEIAGILMDLARREARVFSADFSRVLVTRLGEHVRMHRIPQRSAGFRVLRAPDVPSVLIELGYVSSQKDLEALLSESWRDKAAAQIQIAIEQFFKQARDGVAAKEGTPRAEDTEPKRDNPPAR
jgi:N-acetylmuramoyl-L-alanine amidase